MECYRVGMYLVSQYNRKQYEDRKNNSGNDGYNELSIIKRNHPHPPYGAAAKWKDVGEESSTPPLDHPHNYNHQHVHNHHNQQQSKDIKNR